MSNHPPAYEFRRVSKEASNLKMEELFEQCYTAIGEAAKRGEFRVEFLISPQFGSVAAETLIDELNVGNFKVYASDVGNEGQFGQLLDIEWGE